MKFIIDENLPENFPLWNDSSFCHVLKIKNIVSDSDIWQYALDIWEKIEALLKDHSFIIVDDINLKAF